MPLVGYPLPAPGNEASACSTGFGRLYQIARGIKLHIHDVVAAAAVQDYIDVDVRPLNIHHMLVLFIVSVFSAYEHGYAWMFLRYK